MVFSAKSNNNNNNNNEGWGMGFLLILFHHHPDDDDHHPHHSLTRKKLKPSLSFSSKSTNLLFSKTQSTLSICGLLVFTTLLLFTLSTFEPSSVLHHHVSSSRRFLKQEGNPRNTQKRFSVSSLFSATLKGSEGNFTSIVTSPALQGMGALFLRGSKSMTDLIVGHVNEEVSEKELRTFLRVIHHSGVLSRSDFVFVFPSPLLAAKLGPLVKSECDSFIRLVQLGRELGKVTELGSGLTRYLREVGEGEKEAMWGKRRVNSSEAELTRSSYGSVVGFEVSELDPEDSLSGFLDQVPMRLRRWASYPMLLGRVRRQFKHMLLVDVKSTLILSDPFTRVRNKSSESLFLWSNSDTESTRHMGGGAQVRPVTRTPKPNSTPQ